MDSYYLLPIIIDAMKGIIISDNPHFQKEVSDHIL